MPSAPLKELFDQLGIKVKSPLLFEQAFTHSSYKNESPSKIFLDYERLETLGDAVLSLVVLDISYRSRPEFTPGDLTVLKIDFVQANSLITYGQKFDFPKYIRTGRGIDLSQQVKIIEDVFEAFIGALYLDSGFNRVYQFINDLMGEDIVNFQPQRIKNRDYKSELQIAFQADKKNDLRYQLVSKTGPDNQPFFTVAVYYLDSLLGTGSGKSKKLAEQEAAHDALEKLVR